MLLIVLDLLPESARSITPVKCINLPTCARKVRHDITFINKPIDKLISFIEGCNKGQVTVILLAVLYCLAPTEFRALGQEARVVDSLKSFGAIAA